MLEKLKDIFYDVSDIVVSLIIVALIFFVVSWKISDSLAFEVNIPETTGTTEVASQDPNIVEIQEVTEGDSTGTEVGSEATNQTSDQTSGQSSNETAGTDTSGSTSSDAKPGGTQVNMVGVTKEIEIQSGSSGYSIGKLLAEAGLVADTSTFIKRVEELGLGAKLRSGTFSLSTDMSLDEVIYKISGQ